MSIISYHFFPLPGQRMNSVTEEIVGFGRNPFIEPFSDIFIILEVLVCQAMRH